MESGRRASFQALERVQVRDASSTPLAPLVLDAIHRPRRLRNGVKPWPAHCGCPTQRIQESERHRYRSDRISRAMGKSRIGRSHQNADERCVRLVTNHRFLPENRSGGRLRHRESGGLDEQTLAGQACESSLKGDLHPDSRPSCHCTCQSRTRSLHPTIVQFQREPPILGFLGFPIQMRCAEAPDTLLRKSRPEAAPAMAKWAYDFRISIGKAFRPRPATTARRGRAREALHPCNER